MNSSLLSVPGEHIHNDPSGGKQGQLDDLDVRTPLLVGITPKKIVFVWIIPGWHWLGGRLRLRLRAGIHWKAMPAQHRLLRR